MPVETMAARKVTKNFGRYGEAVAFQDGINAALGLLASDAKVTLGNIFPLEFSGYTTTITVEQDYENGIDF